MPLILRIGMCLLTCFYQKEVSGAWLIGVRIWFLFNCRCQGIKLSLLINNHFTSHYLIICVIKIPSLKRSSLTLCLSYFSLRNGNFTYVWDMMSSLNVGIYWRKYEAFGYKVVVRYSSFFLFIYLFIALFDSSVKAKWTPLKRICCEIAWRSFYLSVMDCNTHTDTHTLSTCSNMDSYTLFYVLWINKILSTQSTTWFQKSGRGRRHWNDPCGLQLTLEHD